MITEMVKWRQRRCPLSQFHEGKDSVSPSNCHYYPYSTMTLIFPMSPCRYTQEVYIGDELLTLVGSLTAWQRIGDQRTPRGELEQLSRGAELTVKSSQIIHATLRLIISI
jgi:hypothetical protein